MFKCTYNTSYVLLWQFYFSMTPPTLLWLSKHNFGTKSDVTSFIKPVDMRISFRKGPFPGVASIIPDTMSIFTRFHIWLYGLLKWSIVIYSRPVPYLVMCERAGWSWILISLGEWGQSATPPRAHNPIRHEALAQCWVSVVDVGPT